MVVWTLERVRTKTIDEVRTLRTNAERLSQADVVALCDQVIAEKTRKPVRVGKKTPSRNIPVYSDVKINQCTAEMIGSLRNLALDLVVAKGGFTEETDQSLDKWILYTGYADAPTPHADIGDLIYVFAANLRNVSGGGPLPGPFGEMARSAIRQLLVENMLCPVRLPEFALACYSHLQSEGAPSLVTAGDIDYPSALAKLANTEIEPDERRQLTRFLRSVVGFINLLYEKYEGSAEIYHESFLLNESEGVPNKLILEKYNEIAHFNGVGVAVAMNFLKDSQVPALRGESLASMYSNSIGQFVKPDMHVLRLMLYLTGRSLHENISSDELIRLTDAKCAEIYAKVPSCSANGREYTLHENFPAKDRGKWNCIEDVYLWADCSKVPPLMIDRLLYLVGSGKYLEGNEISDQETRYNLFFKKFSIAT